MINQILSIFLKTVISLVIAVGFIGVVPLVIRQISEGSICPKIAGIPACYIILGCLTLAALAHFKVMPKPQLFYFIGISIPLAIAIFGTIGHINGFAKCPVGGDGVPMCYYSLALFATLLLIKIFNNSITVV